MLKFEKGHAANPFTQEDVNNVIPSHNGILHMPRGCYSHGLVFKEFSVFPTAATFGCESTFGKGSQFGSTSNFGNKTFFSSYSVFGYNSVFGYYSKFGSSSKFGEYSFFNSKSTFEDGYTPDNWSRPFFAVDRIGSVQRKTYFFSFGGVIHVRAGCFFGNETELLAKLEADRNLNKTRQYRAALELARDVLSN